MDRVLAGREPGALTGRPAADMPDILDRIIARKRIENARRSRLLVRYPLPPADRGQSGLGWRAVEAALQRPPGGALRVIAEIKLRSPSAGVIRPFEPGIVARIAASYEAGGASAISVLCDRPGFGGSPLYLRRASQRVKVPLLFKEFVLTPMQLDLARAAGASMVLLLVRALEPPELQGLVEGALARGLAPVVEAADADELERALATEARIIGINARDLRSFRVDAARAADLVERIPAERIAVSMSGIRDAKGLATVARGRADAVLIGEGLMRAPDPGAQLRQWLAEAG